MQEAKPTPERIFQLFNAYQRTAALKAAIELDLFTAVAQGKMSIADFLMKIGFRRRFRLLLRS